MLHWCHYNYYCFADHESSSVLTIAFASFSGVLCLMILLAVVTIAVVTYFIKKKVRSKRYEV